MGNGPWHPTGHRPGSRALAGATQGSPPQGGSRPERSGRARGLSHQSGVSCHLPESGGPRRGDGREAEALPAVRGAWQTPLRGRPHRSCKGWSGPPTQKGHRPPTIWGGALLSLPRGAAAAREQGRPWPGSPQEPPVPGTHLEAVCAPFGPQAWTPLPQQQEAGSPQEVGTDPRGQGERWRDPKGK